jgi:hypothetical protein
MIKKYNNHVFQKTTKPWQWLAIIAFAISLLTSSAAFYVAHSWIAQGRYLQSIDVDQIEVLRLIPALKELQQQTAGPFKLDSELFTNLKKTERLLRSMTDDIQVPPELASPSSNTNVAAPVKSTTAAIGASSIANARNVSTEPQAVLSDNPALAFFQKLDSKIMKIVFGKPDKYAYLNEEKSEQPEEVVAVKKPKLQDFQDVLINAKQVQQSIGLVLSQEKSLGGLTILSKSAEALLAPKGPLELDKLPTDSPVRKYAESLDAFVKANDAWQRNITDIALAQDLQKALGVVIDQKVLLEIEAGKKSGPPSKQVKGAAGMIQVGGAIELIAAPNPKQAPKVASKLPDGVAKIYQTPWHTKLPQESALALKIYAGNMQTIRDFASDQDALRAVAQKGSSAVKYFDFKSAGGFLGLTAISIFALIAIGIGSFIFLRNTNLNMASQPLSSKAAIAADQLLGSIDLGLNAASEKTTEVPVQKSEPKPSSTPKPEKAEPAPEVKTNITQNPADSVDAKLLEAIQEKMSDIDRRFKVLGQLGNKLRHSVNTLQDKSAQIRSSDGLGDNKESYSGSPEGATRNTPLDQLQDAFYALKQQGVRLYLAILDNHSSKQLALETEQLNLLVDRVESTVSKMRNLIALSLEQADSSGRSAPEISMEAIELLSMDAKQVMRDLDLWQEEFDGLGQGFSDLKRQAKI